MFLSPTRGPVVLSSCGRETLSGGDPNPGGLCSKKKASLLLNRVAGSPGEGRRGTSSRGRLLGHLAHGLPAASLVHQSAPLTPTLPAASHPRPLPCDISTLGPTDRGAWWRVGGIFRVPAACPTLLRLQPLHLTHLAPSAPSAPSCSLSSVAPESKAPARAHSKALHPFPRRGCACQAPCRLGRSGQGSH